MKFTAGSVGIHDRPVAVCVARADYCHLNGPRRDRARSWDAPIWKLGLHNNVLDPSYRVVQRRHLKFHFTAPSAPRRRNRRPPMAGGTLVRRLPCARCWGEPCRSTSGQAPPSHPWKPAAMRGLLCPKQRRKRGAPPESLTAFWRGVLARGRAFLAPVKRGLISLITEGRSCRALKWQQRQT